VVGESVDLNGVQALVLEIDGTNLRPSGGTFHITWSLGLDRKPKHSNDVIEEKGWNSCSPVTVALTPQFFPHKNG
jgi:hypothetical protein